MQQINVRKRSGVLEPIDSSKILAKLTKYSYGLSKQVDINRVAKSIAKGLYDGVTTVELDAQTSAACAQLAGEHPDYGMLAGRIAVNALQKDKHTPTTFSECVTMLYRNTDAQGLPVPLISERIAKWLAIPDIKQAINEMIEPERDYNFDYFGFKTLEKSYLQRDSKGDIIETPQFMYMRVACGIHYPNLQDVKATYDMLSLGLATHATPTLFNAGTRNPQMASCFLLTVQDDSITGIFDTLGKCAQISKGAGGIGLSVSNIRAKGSYIRGTGGRSNGIVPMLRVYNNTARYVDQGGGKRNGSFAIYLEPHHPDIVDFLDLKKNHGKEEVRARDLFYALWISDLFMERVEADAKWSFFCPSVCPDLQDAVGDDYKAMYLEAERDGKASGSIKARELWNMILTAQIEAGTPYMLYKDSCNTKSNQKNLGTIRSSNLCTEIIQYSSDKETAVCNLASIALPKFVTTLADGSKAFDFAGLADVTKQLVFNLNRVIDGSKYPTPETQVSNFAHRPIGLGVQGLADVFALLKMPFDSKEAKQLNKDIFECIYCAALDKSADLARSHGAYSSYKGSPASQGILQHDFWGIKGNLPQWADVRAKIAQYGLRNSLLVAPMPTASTSQILGNNECFEPFNSNIYSRKTMSGEFIVTNKHLVRDLEAIGLWSASTRAAIIRNGGSVQNIDSIPADIKERYKTAYEIKQRDIIDMSADRGAFICQSQSLNLFVESPTFAKLSSIHFYAWKAGLKTGMYYLRSKAASQAVQFTVAKADTEPKLCSLDNPDCEACGS
jgi:ribonucleoside-diphosphate reductase alpha chain